MPSDIIGFTMYSRKNDSFEFHKGVAFCNLLLGDEINRTSPRTQSALLEVMEEKSVTVDGETHILENPFICIATQNPLGSAGTNPLPESQLDRFMVRLSMGYPSTEAQIAILKTHKYQNKMDDVNKVVTRNHITEVQNYLSTVKMTDDILLYITTLCEKTRTMPLVELGVSPRGVLAVAKMARACAVLNERNYVIPEDVQAVFTDVCAHRLVLKPQSKIEGVTGMDVLNEILKSTTYNGRLVG
jgi:MoxR-like ATPase